MDIVKWNHVRKTYTGLRGVLIVKTSRRTSVSARSTGPNGVNIVVTRARENPRNVRNRYTGGDGVNIVRSCYSFSLSGSDILEMFHNAKFNMLCFGVSTFTICVNVHEWRGSRSPHTFPSQFMNGRRTSSVRNRSTGLSGVAIVYRPSLLLCLTFGQNSFLFLKPISLVRTMIVYDFMKFKKISCFMEIGSILVETVPKSKVLVPEVVIL